MGLIDLPSSRDFIESVDWVIPSDKRDFTRSTTDWAIASQDSTVPTDYSFADDSDPFISQVQMTMKHNPISFPYAGPIDGKKSGKWYDHLCNVLIQFGWALKKKFPNKSIPTIVSGNSISQSGFAAAMNLLAPNSQNIDKTTSDTQDPQDSSNDSETIKSFQSFFSKSEPVISKLYNGPIDGKINEELIRAVQATEAAISAAINNKTVSGTILNVTTKKFNTTTSDVEAALTLIQQHKGQKAAFLNSKSRFLVLSSIIIE